MIGFGDYATLLDSFTRADEGPVMTGWSAWISSGLKVLSNQLAPADTGDNGGTFNTALGGPDVEAYLTIVTKPATGGQTILAVRHDPSTGGDGTAYIVTHNVLAGTDTVVLSKIVAGTYTDLATYSLELADGDKLGIRCIGSTIEAWAYTGGRWVKVGSATDSAVPGSGNQRKISIYNYGNGGSGARYDDLYGGVIDVQPTVLSANSLTLSTITPD